MKPLFPYLFNFNTSKFIIPEGISSWGPFDESYSGFDTYL